MERREILRSLPLASAALFVLTGCGTASRPLPPVRGAISPRPIFKPYARRLTPTRRRTIANTPTTTRSEENCRRPDRPIRRVEIVPRAIPLDADEQSDYQTSFLFERPTAAFFAERNAVEHRIHDASGAQNLRGTRNERRRSRRNRASEARPLIGRAGQRARFSDCFQPGRFTRWMITAGRLSGRNTIDLYMATPNEMNAWGARAEPIQILQWGDPDESLRFLERHQEYRHIKRMVLELHGDHQERPPEWNSEILGKARSLRSPNRARSCRSFRTSSAQSLP